MACKLFSEDCVAGHTIFHQHHPSGRIYRPQGVDSWILNLTTGGCGIINPGSDGEFRVYPGDLLLFPPNVIHDYYPPPTKDWIHDWIVFQETDHLHELLFSGSNIRNYAAHIRLYGETASQIATTMQKAQYWMFHVQNAVLRRRLILNAVEEILLLCQPLRNTKDTTPLAAKDERIEKACHWLHTHFTEPFSLERLSVQANLSVSRFSHLFQKELGISPGAYLLNLRISKARELLLTSSRTLSDIAAACGFEDPLYFSRLFRRETGISPRGYQQGFAGTIPVYDSANINTDNETIKELDSCRKKMRKTKNFPFKNNPPPVDDFVREAEKDQ